jgi:hypothetical protein
MSRPLDPVVPPALRQALDADPRGDGWDVTVLVLVVRDDGWPHLGMVSAGELVALDERRLRLALWPGSTATARLAAGGPVTLSAVLDGTSYAVRGSVRRLDDVETPRSGRLACFDVAVEAATADEAPYAVLESGVRFRLRDPAETLARWRELRAALRDSA